MSSPRGTLLAQKREEGEPSAALMNHIIQVFKFEYTHLRKTVCEDYCIRTIVLPDRRETVSCAYYGSLVILLAFIQLYQNPKGGVLE